MTDMVRIDVDVSDCPPNGWGSTIAPQVLTDWLAEKVSTVPVEYRDSMRFETRVVDDYGSSVIETAFYYNRPMTELEIASRDAARRDLKEQRRRQLETELAALSRSE